MKTLDPRATDGVSMGKRSLKNLCVAYLAADGNAKFSRTLFKQATTAKNMTDQIAALGILSDKNSPCYGRALWRISRNAGANIRSLWTTGLSVQAGARRSDVQKTVERLMRHPAVDLKNPNRVSALIRVFAGNSFGFHAANGNGYRFIAGMIARLDPINPA